MAETKIVAGLGNPGSEYSGTRHNIGFRVIDVLAETLQVGVRRKKFGAVFGQGEHAGKKLILLKPWRYMNRSGDSIVTVVGFYKLDISDLLVVTDDMALGPGRLRIRANGSSGGHNGLADVIEKLGTEDVARLRIGIGPSENADGVDYVLDEPTEAEKPRLDAALERAREAVLCWVEYGIEAAMNEYNRTCEQET
ncbi:MAG: aminoacyl-tRNA hydrolase [Planctomycetota bacterium]|jgi:PTH1 family peptidyl-tRNA hydrolase